MVLFLYDTLTMMVIDARTGSQVLVGQTVEYGDGEHATLVAFSPGILRAQALIRNTYRAGDQLVTSEAWVPLPVRWMHPGFFGKPVAFIPS